jgi:transposase
LDEDGRHITFTDGCDIGRLRLVGNRGQQIETFPLKQIKRVRIVRRADGYYVQRHISHMPTGKKTGIDVGLKAFSTSSDGHTVENPRYMRLAEKKLKKLHRQLSRKKKGSSNRNKARKQLAKAHLQVQRQREDFARKQANALITSSDLIAFEDPQIRHLAKSNHDAGWGQFLTWVKAYGVMHDIPVITFSPKWTSAGCSVCGTRVHKSLSVRTHICPNCGLVLDRDHNAALNILQHALAGTVGHMGTPRSAENASGPKRARSKRAG